MSNEILDLRIEDIHIDEEFNCRGHIAPMNVVELARDIDLHGLTSPVIVQPYDAKRQAATGKKYRLVAGYRRATAFGLLKRETIPCIVKLGLDDARARIINLTENIQRQDLNPLQEAKAVEELRKLRYSREQIATELSMSQGWVQVRTMIIELPEEIQQEVAAGLLTSQHIRDLHSLKGRPEEQFNAVKLIKDRKATGSKRPISIKPKNANPKIKKERKAPEIYKLQEHIRKAFDDEPMAGRLARIVLGWVAGDASDRDVFETVQQIADQHGLDYKIPQITVDQMED